MTTLADLDETDRDLIRCAARNGGSVGAQEFESGSRKDAAFRLERAGVFRFDIDDEGQPMFDLTATGRHVADALGDDR